MQDLIIPSAVPPLFLVVGLLFYWRHYRMRMDAGLVTARHLFGGSGSRFFLYVTPEDPDVCAPCRQAQGTVLMAQTVKPDGASSFNGFCLNPEKCGGLLLPFSGRWLEAKEVMERVALSPQQRVRLTVGELLNLTSVVRHLPADDQDRPGLHLVSAYLQERNNPEQAIRSYGAVLDQASDAHALLLIPAYLRLAGLLARRGDLRKALQVIEHFEKRYARAEMGTGRPTGKQRRAVITMKAYLYALNDPTSEAPFKPATIRPVVTTPLPVDGQAASREAAESPRILPA